ncbi:hypothetical protein DL89DRAFT_265956 [Linderina pennispora]|uniref:Major facilitator superfamily (MFS) profile domain-containing protein n=1 Tax=Linderina pennispora TaxID=61395 RepID=A0A1Y1WFU4_9FUNG|nr:uncharacterized protein DL89DRAFT_265956 [Linderina pennispora]ORX72393.1 hypothetical protein DL89DRAFT_265956 [Linderina pennispora]
MSASQIGLFVAIVLSVPMGWTVDWMLRRFGEGIRPFIVLAGLALTSSSVLLMGFCTTFTMVLGANTWLAIVILIVNIPVMSSFGDFVNSLGLNSMAQSYGIYNAFWALASTIAPPIATTLYTRIGYRSTVAGLLTGLCIVCSVLIMAEPLWRLCKRAMRTVVERK